MAQRYARIDVDFFHKKTANKLMDALGNEGALVFLALILRAKDGVDPGTFVYSSDAVAWEKLGFDSRTFNFTLDEFFKVTGRLKQTSRTRVGHRWNVKLTHYEAWQKDSRRYEERAKKSRIRRQSTGDGTGDTIGDTTGDTRGTKNVSRSRTTSTPKPPKENQNGNTPHPQGREWHRHDCPTCGARQPSKSALEDHLRIFHELEPDPDDIPF